MIRTRHVVHRGRVEAAGYLIDPALIGEAEARRRIARCYERGSRVLAIDEGYVVTLPTAVPILAERAPGLPLVKAGAGLSAVPEMNADPGELVLLRAGLLVHVDLDVAKRVPLTELVDLSGFERLAAKPLGEPPPPPQPISSPRASIREILTEVPAQASEAAEIWGDAPGSGQPAAPSLFERMLSWLRERLVSGRRPQVEPSDGDIVVAPTQPSGWWSKLIDAFDRFAVRFLNLSRLSRLLGQRQASYLRRLLDMFEDDRLDEALRHAIPLAKEGTPGGGRPAYGVPSPRDHLAITAGNQGGGSMMALGDELFDLLRERYRRAFERLERAGRIEEAAFVLAELLGETEEAISFLERHGELVKAAELAESRGVAPAIVVRQWIIAGEWTRAVRIARRHHAFGEAVMLLSKTHPAIAKSLRLLWADALAEAGDFVGAVDVVWKVREATHLVSPWIDAAIEVGGTVAARMMVKALVLVPDGLESVRERISKLLDDDDAQSVYARRAFLEALALEPPSPALAACAKPALRAAYRDVGLHGLPLRRDLHQKALRTANDSAFSTDLPKKPLAKPPTDVVEIVIDEADGGTVAIHDAAMLPSGRFLVAIGEAGAVLLTRDGRLVKHFVEPCQWLVPSDGGHRAIAIAGRGDVKRLARLDLVHQRAHPWTDIALDHWAPTFDGWQWFVSLRRGLEALDVMSTTALTAWRVNKCQPVAIQRDAQTLSVIARADHDELWVFQAPSLTLRTRAAVSHPALGWSEISGMVRQLAEEGSASVFVCGALSAGGETSLLECIDRREDRELTVARNWRIGRHTVELPPASEILSMVRTDEHVAVATATALGVHIQIIDVANGDLRARLTLLGSNTCSMRLDAHHLVIGDDRGRLLAVDVALGVLVRSVRVRA